MRVSREGATFCEFRGIREIAKVHIGQALTRIADEYRCSLLSFLSENRKSANFS